MKEIFPIPGPPTGRLAIVTRPRAGLTTEVAARWREAKLTHVLSLLEDFEVAELGLAGEAESCQMAGLHFRRFPLPDGGVPGSADDLSVLVKWLVHELHAGASVGIHCRMGIGRSALVAVCVLVSLGIGVDEAWDLVEEARGTPVPHMPWQRDWVAEWAEKRAPSV